MAAGGITDEGNAALGVETDPGDSVCLPAGELGNLPRVVQILFVHNKYLLSTRYNK